MRAASRRQLAEQVSVCRRRPASDAPQTVQRLTALASAPVDREPAAWETNAAGPFLSVGEVGVYALGEDRFRLVAPEGEREVEGFEPARELAHELAGLPAAPH
jgi:hypothetical protein